MDGVTALSNSTQGIASRGGSVLTGPPADRRHQTTADGAQYPATYDAHVRQPTWPNGRPEQHPEKPAVVALPAAGAVVEESLRCLSEDHRVTVPAHRDMHIV